jgi:hypothetical protein
MKTAVELQIEMETEVRGIAAKLLAAYCSNPALMPNDEYTLTDLRRMAIDQARDFYAEACNPIPRQAPTAKGIIVRMMERSKAGGFWKVSTYGKTKLMDGDEHTRKYLAQFIAEERETNRHKCTFKMEGTRIGFPEEWHSIDESKLLTSDEGAAALILASPKSVEVTGRKEKR